MSDLKANFEVFLSIAVLGFALLQTIVAGISYSRLRNPKLLLIGLALLAFTAKGLYLTAETIDRRADPADWIMFVGLFDLGVLLLLYFAVRSP